jgi:ribosomal protein L19
MLTLNYINFINLNLIFSYKIFFFIYYQFLINLKNIFLNYKNILNFKLNFFKVESYLNNYFFYFKKNNYLRSNYIYNIHYLIFLKNNYYSLNFTGKCLAFIKKYRISKIILRNVIDKVVIELAFLLKSPALLDFFKINLDINHLFNKSKIYYLRKKSKVKSNLRLNMYILKLNNYLILKYTYLKLLNYYFIFEFNFGYLKTFFEKKFNRLFFSFYFFF